MNNTNNYYETDYKFIYSLEKGSIKIGQVIWSPVNRSLYSTKNLSLNTYRSYYFTCLEIAIVLDIFHLRARSKPDYGSINIFVLTSGSKIGWIPITNRSGERPF